MVGGISLIWAIPSYMDSNPYSVPIILTRKKHTIIDVVTSLGFLKAIT